MATVAPTPPGSSAPAALAADPSPFSAQDGSAPVAPMPPIEVIDAGATTWEEDDPFRTSEALELLIRRHDARVTFKLNVFIQEFFYNVIGYTLLPLIVWRHSWVGAENRSVSLRNVNWVQFVDEMAFIAINVLFALGYRDRGSAFGATWIELVTVDILYLLRAMTVAAKYSFFSDAEYGELDARLLSNDERRQKLILAGWMDPPDPLLYLEMERSIMRNYPQLGTLHVVFPTDEARADALRIMKDSVPSFLEHEGIALPSDCRSFLLSNLDPCEADRCSAFTGLGKATGGASSAFGLGLPSGPRTSAGSLSSTARGSVATARGSGPQTRDGGVAAAATAATAAGTMMMTTTKVDDVGILEASPEDRSRRVSFPNPDGSSRDAGGSFTRIPSPTAASASAVLVAAEAAGPSFSPTTGSATASATPLASTSWLDATGGVGGGAGGVSSAPSSARWRGPAKGAATRDRQSPVDRTEEIESVPSGKGSSTVPTTAGTPTSKRGAGRDSDAEEDESDHAGSRLRRPRDSRESSRSRGGARRSQASVGDRDSGVLPPRPLGTPALASRVGFTGRMRGESALLDQGPAPPPEGNISYSTDGLPILPLKLLMWFVVRDGFRSFRPPWYLESLLLVGIGAVFSFLPMAVRGVLDLWPSREDPMAFAVIVLTAMVNVFSWYSGIAFVLVGVLDLKRRLRVGVRLHTMFDAASVRVMRMHDANYAEVETPIEEDETYDMELAEGGPEPTSASASASAADGASFWRGRAGTGPSATTAMAATTKTTTASMMMPGTQSSHPFPLDAPIGSKLSLRDDRGARGAAFAPGPASGSLFSSPNGNAHFRPVASMVNGEYVIDIQKAVDTVLALNFDHGSPGGVGGGSGSLLGQRSTAQGSHGPHGSGSANASQRTNSLSGSMGSHPSSGGSSTTARSRATAVDLLLAAAGAKSPAMSPNAHAGEAAGSGGGGGGGGASTGWGFGGGVPVAGTGSGAEMSGAGGGMGPGTGGTALAGRPRGGLHRPAAWAEENGTDGAGPNRLATVNEHSEAAPFSAAPGASPAVSADVVMASSAASSAAAAAAAALAVSAGGSRVEATPGTEGHAHASGHVPATDVIHPTLHPVPTTSVPTAAHPPAAEAAGSKRTLAPAAIMVRRKIVEQARYIPTHLVQRAAHWQSQRLVLSVMYPENTVGWYHTRNVAMDVGRQYNHRIQVYTSFFFCAVLASLIILLVVTVLDENFGSLSRVLIISQTFFANVIFSLALLAQVIVGISTNRSATFQRRQLGRLEALVQEYIISPPVTIPEAAIDRLKRSRKVLSMAAKAVQTEMELSPMRVMGLPANLGLLTSMVSMFASGIFAVGSVLLSGSLPNIGGPG